MFLTLPRLSSSTPGCSQGCSSHCVPHSLRLVRVVLSLEDVVPEAAPVSGAGTVVWLGRNGLDLGGSIAGQPLAPLPTVAASLLPAPGHHTRHGSSPGHPATIRPGLLIWSGHHIHSTPLLPLLGTGLARSLCKLAPSGQVCLLQTLPSRQKWSESDAGRNSESRPRREGPQGPEVAPQGSCRCGG